MPESYPLAYIGEIEALPAVRIKDKYYVIYRRTKKARIKKKAAKKSWTLYLQNLSKKSKTITITIGGDSKCLNTKMNV